MQQRAGKSVSPPDSHTPLAETFGARAATAISRLDPDGLCDSFLKQVLLQVHRFSIAEINKSGVLEEEIRRVSERVAAKLETVPEELKQKVEVDLQSTHLGAVGPETAELVHDAYHYLGSPRGNGIHLGLYSDSIPQRPKLMTLVTLSELDLPHIITTLPSGIHRQQVMVLARLFSFSWCPRNAMSRTLGLTFSWVRKHRPDVRMLLTYLDPNLGFRGTVYRATNWSLFGREKKTRYLYLDGEYVTDRRMIRDYGTADPRKLFGLLGSRIGTSRVLLQPLEIYSYFLAQRDRAKYDHGVIHEFTPPSELVGG